MLDWVGGLVDSVLAVAILVVVVLLLIILLPRLLRRLHALLRGEVDVLLEPWTSLLVDAEHEDVSAGLGRMFLFELRRVQDIHARTINRIEISNTYRDIPTFTEGLSTDIDLLASEELEGDIGKIATFTGVILRLMPLLTPRTRLHGSIRQFGTIRTLELTLEHYPVQRRPTYTSATLVRRGASRLRARLARIGTLIFGQRQTLTWEVRNDAATNGNISDDVRQAAYRVYLDLLGDNTFKSWKCFRLFTDGLERHVRFMDLDRREDLEHAESYYREALTHEPKNQVVSYNLGVVHYMKYASAKTNREALDCFYKAVSSPNLQLKARAHAGIANAETMAVDRFREGGRYQLEVGLQHATEAVALAPKLDASHKAYAYANHQLAEWIDREGGDPARKRHYERAEVGYRAAIKANPGHYIAYNNLANLYLGEAIRLKNAGQSPRRLLIKAKKTLESALEINAAFPFAYDNLGNVYVELEMLDDAYRSYLAAVRFDPDYPEAHNDLAMLLLRADFDKPVTEEFAGLRHRAAIDAARRKAPTGAEKRIEKLCNAFDARWRELKRTGNLREAESPDAMRVHESCRPFPPSLGRGAVEATV